jgi:hypothetical protein
LHLFFEVVQVEILCKFEIKSIFAIFIDTVGLPGRPRTVIDFERDNVTTDEAVLSRIILHPEVKDRKIVSLSIVGAFRKGKSFLLDYMLRYLYFTVSLITGLISY